MSTYVERLDITPETAKRWLATAPGMVNIAKCQALATST
jgi:hypothetical protein